MSVKTRYASFLLSLILMVYIINGVCYLNAQSITSDEGSFMHYAVRLAKGHPERIFPVRDNSKMPISLLNVIPRAIEQRLHPGLKKTDWGENDIVLGRYVTLFVSLFIIILVYTWSKELYGVNAGLFSAFLISFCPNMIANAGLVTTDSYSMLSLLTTMYYLWKFCNNPSKKYFVLFAVCLAMAQLVKQSLFHLYIICPVTMGVHLYVNRYPVRWKQVVMGVAVLFLINWVIINAGFYFRDTNTLIGNYHFLSNTFIGLQKLLPAWVPVPLPHAFVTGLDMAKYYDQLGGGNDAISSFGKVTILGKSSTGGRFWYYYVVTLFFKTPVSNMIFMAAAITLMIKSRAGQMLIRNEFFLLTPVLYFFTYMSLLYNTQCGIRQIIFIYPFLYILCGSIMNYLHLLSMKVVFLALCILLVISVLRYRTNYYPYTNEFIWDKKMAFSYVGAGNLELHQGDKFFKRYLLEHPGVKMAGVVPAEGVYLINTADYLDIWNRHRFDWLSSIKPSGHVAYNGLLITVTRDDLKDLPVKKPGK